MCTVGPDAYRRLPDLVEAVRGSDHQQAMDVQLSIDETYGDISPVRYNSNGTTAFVSIMRGCNNMCAFCVVPFTRGRERSREVDSILKEIEDLKASGFGEVTVLGQNVNSYHDRATESMVCAQLVGGPFMSRHTHRPPRHTAATPCLQRPAYTRVLPF